MIDKKKKQLYQIFVTFMLCIIAAISLIPFIYLIITSCVNDMSLVFKNGIALKITSDMLHQILLCWIFWMGCISHPRNS